MSGMNKTTGKPITGADHIAQSIADILTTPLGSCVMRRNYGSRLFELLDAPLGKALPALLVAATAGAIRKWEPRVSLTRVSATGFDAQGAPRITLIGHRKDIPGNPPFTLSISL